MPNCVRDLQGVDRKLKQMREKKKKEKKKKKKKSFPDKHTKVCCFTSIHSFVSSLIAIIKKLEVHSHYCARLNSQSAGVERVKPNRTGLPQDKGRERKTDRQTDRQTNGRADR